MRKYLFALLVLVAAGTTLLVAAFAVAGSGSHKISAKDGLEGYQEVPTISTTGNGTFEAKVNDDGVELRLDAELLGTRGQHHAVAHPLRPAIGERWHLDLPVQQPRQRAGRDATLSTVARDDQRHG